MYCKKTFCLSFTVEFVHFFFGSIDAVQCISGYCLKSVTGWKASKCRSWKAKRQTHQLASNSWFVLFVRAIACWVMFEWIKYSIFEKGLTHAYLEPKRVISKWRDYSGHAPFNLMLCHRFFLIISNELLQILHLNLPFIWLQSVLLMNFVPFQSSPPKNGIALVLKRRAI